jgi:hypothetical protein
LRARTTGNAVVETAQNGTSGGTRCAGRRSTGSVVTATGGRLRLRVRLEPNRRAAPPGARDFRDLLDEFLGWHIALGVNHIGDD